jgi:hypothetical protein
LGKERELWGNEEKKKGTKDPIQNYIGTRGKLTRKKNVGLFFYLLMKIYSLSLVFPYM